MAIGAGEGLDPAGGVLLRCGAGTRLRTPDGARAVEMLRPGDVLCDVDRAPVTVLGVARRVLSAGVLAMRPDLRPLRLRRGSLGDGMPRRDLRLAPQHRLLLRGVVLEALLDEESVLAPVGHLVDGLAVSAEAVTGPVLYHQVTCDRPAILVAEGVPVEGVSAVHAARPGPLPGLAACSRQAGDAAAMGGRLDGTARALMAYLARAA